MIGLLSAALFGAATPACKWLLVSITPFQLAGLLYIGAAIAVTTSTIKSGGVGLPARSNKRNRKLLLGAVICGGVLAPIFLLFALKTAQSTSVSLWLNLELAVTAVLGVLFFRDHLDKHSWVGVFLAFLATVVLTWEQGIAGISAGFLILLTCCCWGLDNHFTALIDGITPQQSTFWKGLVSGVINLTIGISLDPLPNNYILIVYAILIGIFSYGFSIVLYIKSAQELGATRAQILFSSAPFFGVSLSLFYLNEPFTWFHAVASALFLGAIISLLWGSHAHLHEHKAVEHEHSHRHDDLHHNHTHDNLDPATRHSHPHEHAEVIHKHPHWPDLHHRHDHKKT